MTKKSLWWTGTLEPYILNSVKMKFWSFKKFQKKNPHVHMDVCYTCGNSVDEISNHVSYTQMTKSWFWKDEQCMLFTIGLLYLPNILIIGIDPNDVPSLHAHDFQRSLIYCPRCKWHLGAPNKIKRLCYSLHACEG